MPRPKKPGAPEPKKRSRNGCWPCKARKVKCDEAHPTCLSCQRQNEVCDYSVRLNWNGRGKRKAEPTGGRQTIFHVNTLSADFDVSPKEAVKVEASISPPNGTHYGTRPSSREHVADQAPTTTDDYRHTEKHSTTTIPKLATWSMEPPSLDSIKEPSTDNISIDPVLTGQDTQQPCASPPFQYASLNSLYTQPFEQSYERYRDGHDIKSPSESGMESPTGSSFVDFAGDTRSSKRLRYGPSSSEIHSRFTEMALPIPLPSRYNTEIHFSQSFAPMSTSSQSDDGQRSLSVKLAPLTSNGSHMSEWRRLSIDSLLSGAPGMSNAMGTAGSTSREQTPLPYGDPRDDIITLGVDKGLRDLDIGKNDDANAISKEYSSLDFSFGQQTKVATFEKGGYYESPVWVKIPRSFHPLPPILQENPMNILYFHHFISHTATLLVPHHCSSNPFQKILPQIALQCSHLMKLVLAYSASHRARLLNHREPITRISLWVQGFFSYLRDAIDDPKKIVTDSCLAGAIMLASLEIICPKAFGVEIPWQEHLTVARQLIVARGEANPNSEISATFGFLLRWFAYLGVLGRLTGGHKNFLSITEGLVAYDSEGEHGLQIVCLLGFTSRCASILSKIADLAALCAPGRFDDTCNERLGWQPTDDVRQQAEQLLEDLEHARTSSLIQHCPHLHSSEEEAYQWDSREMAATNEAYHWAGLIHLHRRVLGKPSTDKDVQTAVREIVNLLHRVRKASAAEACLLFPMFSAGCDAQDAEERSFIMERMRNVEGIGMSQVRKARNLIQNVWDTGKPWEMLASGEFVG
ncbi:hypothetical protein VC83_09022 [Pseudogymnoascus destructans]|uniref:Zn(2)-C6 fungal-type domain-containing protein n=2 Tax=Pseudogymnoascus destructans TaxID=655981 RepID=L8FTR3_PSED2|nr:uncharacterized protein VC83_09022 [Pseudogymnoascus destructans]ELR03944.1 hypothetical protein GMDG_06472 [Pseudogymnoascus destructans 20631-21]OAF54500.1 hypothetical protein VC83_09022 [Pseudogymnoascus destructans]